MENKCWIPKLNNRHFMGVEIDNEYFKIAEERINNAMRSVASSLL